MKNTKVCPNCGTTATENLPICPNCGTKLAVTQVTDPSQMNSANVNNSTFANNQNTYVNANKSNSDGMVIAGFVLSIASLFGVFSPFIGWICGALGFIFSNNSIRKGSSDSNAKLQEF